jgi:hypothetical protein
MRGIDIAAQYEAVYSAIGQDTLTNGSREDDAIAGREEEDRPQEKDDIFVFRMHGTFV